MIFSLYFQIILSYSFSFLLHLFNFKKHLHSFLTLLTTTNATDPNNNNNNNINKLNLKFQNRPKYSSKAKLSISLPPPLSIRDMQQLMMCTENIGFASNNEMQLVNDSNSIDEIEGDEIEGDDYSWKRNTEAVEGGVNSNNTFPPPLSSLDVTGQPNFVLLPVRNNGRLQLKKVSVKRSSIIYANRENGRLRLYIVPDQCDNIDLEQEECHIEEEEEEEKEITNVESELLSEEEMVEESIYEEEDRVREWNNERCRGRCNQQLVNNIYGSYNNLLMYGVSTA